MTKSELKKSLKKIHALENELMRELTDKEVEVLLERGDEAMLFECLGITEEDLEIFKDIKELVMNYCTRTEDVFDALVRSKDHSLAYMVLKSITNAIENAELCDNHPECDETLSVEKCKVENEDCKSASIGSEQEPVLNEKDITKAESKPTAFDTWLDAFLHAAGAEPWFKELEHTFKTCENRDEACGTALDNTKDLVIENLIERLKGGEELELEPEILNEVQDRLWNDYNNISVTIHNNKIKATFKK